MKTVVSAFECKIINLLERKAKRISDHTRHINHIKHMNMIKKRTSVPANTPTPTTIASVDTPKSDYIMGETDIDILMVCHDNTAGIFALLCHGINEHTGYRARFVQTRNRYLKYPTDLLLDQDSPSEKREELSKMAKSCNAIHWNQTHWNQRAHSYNKFDFDFSPYLNNKIHTCHERGTLLRRRSHLPHEYKVIFLSTPDLLYYCPEGLFLPNPMIPLNEFKITYPETKHVIQCPTSLDTIGKYMSKIPKERRIGVFPDYFPINSTVKSTDLFTDAMEKIKAKTGVTYAIHHGINNQTCLTYKAACSFYFDQMMAGSYGVNAIEALFLRKPVMARLSNHTRQTLHNWSGDECPVLQVEMSTLDEDILRHLSLDEKSLGIECERWATKTHGIREISKIFVEQVLE